VPPFSQRSPKSSKLFATSSACVRCSAPGSASLSLAWSRQLQLIRNTAAHVHIAMDRRIVGSCGRAAAAQEAISRAAPAPAAPPQLRRPLAALPRGLSTHRIVGPCGRAAVAEAISRACPATAVPPQLRRPLAALPIGLSTHRPRPPTRSCIRPTALVAPRAARRPRAPHRCPGATALGRRCTSMLSRSKLLLPSCAGPTALAARHAASSALD